MNARVFMQRHFKFVMVSLVLVLVGFKCPTGLVQPTITASPRVAQPNTDILFEGDVTVSPPLVLAKFRDEPTPGDDDPVDNGPAPQGTQFNFDFLFVGFPIRWDWDFGDGTTGVGQNVIHQYTAPGCYDVSLTVTLSNGFCGTATINDAVCIGVDDIPNRPPVADAGDDRTEFLTNLGKQESGSVELDGTESFDPDGDTITYSWTVVRTPGQTKGISTDIELSGANTANPTFIPFIAGEYEFQLTVDDGKASKVASQPDNVVITMQFPNFAPIADAGPDRTEVLATPAKQESGGVQLDGTQSFDPNGDPITYAWTVVRTPAVAPPMPAPRALSLSNADTATPTFFPFAEGEYEFQLIVNDGKPDKVASQPDNVIITMTEANLPPTANAGPDETVTLSFDDVKAFDGSVVTLDGSASFDPNGDTITYAWTIVSQPGAGAKVVPGITLENANTVSPSFEPSIPGEYEFSLIVDDGQPTKVASNPDTVVITVLPPNSPPTALPSIQEKAVVRGELIHLLGNGTDPQGDALTYLWSIESVPGGSTAALSSNVAQNPTVNADLLGTYTFGLIVNDGKPAKIPSPKATVVIDCINQVPDAEAGPPQTVENKTLVSLNGSGSSDADSDPLTFAWTIESAPGGSTATLSNATTSTPSFTPDVAGPYVLGLVVNDGFDDSSMDTVTISVTNDPPQANAGGDQTLFQFEEVQLDGTGSSDPNSDPLTFAWTIVSQPIGSVTTLQNPTSSTPTFIPDVAGNYTIGLIVNDGQPAAKVASTQDTVTITASEPVLPLFVCHDFDFFDQGPSDEEINDGMTFPNELPQMPGIPTEAISMADTETTNIQYVDALNFALSDSFAFENQAGDPYDGGDVFFNGVRLLQIAGGSGAGEFSDIEFDSTLGLFFVKRRDNQSMAEHPVTEVSWFGAIAYCVWVNTEQGFDATYDLTTFTFSPGIGPIGFQLPNEDNWEHAAAWNNATNTHFIFGFSANTIDPTRANFASANPLTLTNPPFTTNVGFYNGSNAGTVDSRSPAGCFDMTGNVWEWTQTAPFDYTPPFKAAGGDFSTDEIIVRGGSWQETDTNELRTARRDSAEPSVCENFIGFRIMIPESSCFEEEE
ncbi:MAG: hypothetical protein AMXMBFR84_24980 [Candidatus Hydrogenedentota bacterium]